MLDVEMEDAPVASKAGPSSSRASQTNQLQLQVDQTSTTTTLNRQIYLALDTNILMSHLELVKKLYTRLKEYPTLPVSGTIKKQAGLTDGSQADPLKGDVCILLPYVVLDGEFRCYVRLSGHNSSDEMNGSKSWTDSK
jgi:hypothetical protein